MKFIGFNNFYNLSFCFRSLCAGTTFQLRQGDVSLMCEVINLPHYNITEATLNNQINSFIVDRTSHQV